MNVSLLTGFLRKRPLGAAKYALMYLASEEDTTGEAVFSWSVDEIDAEADTLAEEILTTAQEHADEQGIICRYRFTVSDKRDKVIAQKRLKVKPLKLTRTGDPLSLEFKGKDPLDQMIRMNESFLRAFEKLQSTIQTSYQKSLESMREEIEQLRVSEQHMRQLISESEINSVKKDEGDNHVAEIFDRLLGLVEKVGPQLADKVGETVGRQLAGPPVVTVVREIPQNSKEVKK